MNTFQKSLFVGLGLFAVSSHAALFDDKEARKKILEVETKSQTNDETHLAEINELKKRDVIQAQGLQDMLNQIELLKQEVAQLRGEIEVANHVLETAEQRQKDLYADTDTRLRKLEGSPVDSGTDQAVDPALEDGEDAVSFKKAYGLSRAAKHKDAFKAYDAFIKEYPDSKLIPDALYGLGYSQFALKNYKSSVATQQKLLKAYAEHSKVPSAMYSIANSQIQLGQVSNAKKTLKSLIEKHPTADVIPNAKKRLKVLETIK